MNIYREEIMDHYKNPRNWEKLKLVDKVERKANVSCGDVIEMGIKWRENKKGRMVKEIRFKGEGCAISRAGASMLTEWLKGKNEDEVKKLTEKKMLKILGIELSPGRKKCATLGFEVWQKLLKRAILLK